MGWLDANEYFNMELVARDRIDDIRAAIDNAALADADGEDSLAEESLPGALDPGAAVEDLRGACHRLCVMRTRRRGEVRRGRALGREVVVVVDAAHEHGAVDGTGQLLHVRRDVADREADASIAGAIGGRAVHHPHVVQRHLAGPQQDVDPARLVDLDRDLLSA
jgi:hypothetical protein